MFERILVGGQGCTAFFDPLTDDHAIRFEVANALLVSANDGFAVRFDETIHKLRNLAFDL
ncbi:hypothetical protein ACP2AV_07400 [Aliiroseovarius sp. PTFE2010]|uniref:hypothetical protein n=1 Tax=Aliiroseovarius sp. PTFE2010 TaxID=3417190 RepID=UPI003CF0C0F2